MLHNLKFICPIIATYIINCYTTPSRLFIVGGGEILSSEGATQVDPTVMGFYGPNSSSTINKIPAWIYQFKWNEC